MSNWDAKIHTNDPYQSFIIVIKDYPTKQDAMIAAIEWLETNYPKLSLRDLVVEKSQLV